MLTLLTSLEVYYYKFFVTKLKINRTLLILMFYKKLVVINLQALRGETRIFDE